MLLAGDEFGRSQQGNNNAYCQDNEISWLNWDEADEELLAFTRKLIDLRKKHPVFRRRKWFQGQPIKGSELKDIAWFLPEGTEMEEHHWQQGFALSLGVFLNGQGIRSLGPKGEKILDDSFYLMFNASHIPIDYKLPPENYGIHWYMVLDTSKDLVRNTKATFKNEGNIIVEGRSVVVLRQAVSKPEEQEDGNAD